MTIAPAHTATRNATLDDMVATLRAQHAEKLDVVVPANKLACVGGVLMLDGTEPLITDDGVSETVGFYRPTIVFDEGISRILSIPLAYVRRLRLERVDLYDANVNGWLAGDGSTGPDPRKFLIRLFRGSDGGEGVARSIHSDSYARIDNFDTLVAALTGIENSGIHVQVGRTDLTDRRMYVEFTAPEVNALAPTLLGNYTSPFSGLSGLDLPIVFAGFILENSETGCGAYKLTPRLVAQVCTNGMTRTFDAVRAIHRGSALDEGVIKWSMATQRKLLDFITAKTTDAVNTFLTPEYVEGVVAELEEKSGTPVSEPVEAVKKLGKELAFDEATSNGVLQHFLMGRDLTAGGVLHAVTSYAQTVEDADVAHELEEAGMKAFAMAARGL